MSDQIEQPSPPSRNNFSQVFQALIDRGYEPERAIMEAGDNLTPS